ncbi:uncharacterized protein LOC130675311 [Microplitis mediator]|uniref:uncharacterized protein LOC130675311 n=1 Tax=Microplitis mediator TaxID=375433 RepID=UPI002553DE68|nr:uncharacterized protein LOC130675311 [Microplitis mediator]
MAADFKYHLIECLKNHKMARQYQHHMTVCESNASVDLQLNDRNDRKCFSAIISDQDAMAQLEAALGASSNEVKNNPARPDDPQKLQELEPIRSQRNEYQEQGKIFTNRHVPLAKEKNKTIDKAGYDSVKAKLDDPAFRTLNCESKEKNNFFFVSK